MAANGLVNNFETQLAQNRTLPNEVVIVCPTRFSCPWCNEAKRLATQYGLSVNTVWDDVAATLVNYIAGKNDQVRTYPRCFMGGQLVGGYDDLKRRLSSAPAPALAPALTPPPPGGLGPSGPSGPSGPNPSDPSGSTTPSAAAAVAAASAAMPQRPPISNIKTFSSGLSPLEEGLFAGSMIPDRELNWAPIVGTIGTNLAPLADDLKKCLTSGFAELFVKTAPVMIDRIIESVVRTAEEDPVVKAHLERRVLQMILEIKASGAKESILRNLDGECREVFIHLQKGAGLATAQPSRRTRRRQPRRSY
jgi:glutaredoxin